MKKTIWKFPIPAFNGIIEIPKNFNVLTLQVQNGQPCLWAEVEPDDEKLDLLYQVIGTGHEVPENMNYVGTWQDMGGSLVWHLYIKIA